MQNILGAVAFHAFRFSKTTKSITLCLQTLLSNRVDLAMFFNFFMWSKVVMLKLPEEEIKMSISDTTHSMPVATAERLRNDSSAQTKGQVSWRAI